MEGLARCLHMCVLKTLEIINNTLSDLFLFLRAGKMFFELTFAFINIYSSAVCCQRLTRLNILGRIYVFISVQRRLI